MQMSARYTIFFQINQNQNRTGMDKIFISIELLIKLNNKQNQIKLTNYSDVGVMGRVMLESPNRCHSHSENHIKWKLKYCQLFCLILFQKRLSRGMHLNFN